MNFISSEHIGPNPDSLSTPEEDMWGEFFTQIWKAVRKRKKFWGASANSPFKSRIVDSAPNTPPTIIRTIEEYPGAVAYKWVWRSEYPSNFRPGNKTLAIDMAYWTERDDEEDDEPDRFIEVTFTITNKRLVAFGKRPNYQPGDDEEKLVLTSDANKIRGLEHLAIATVIGRPITNS